MRRETQTCVFAPREQETASIPFVDLSFRLSSCLPDHWLVRLCGQCRCKQTIACPVSGLSNDHLAAHKPHGNNRPDCNIFCCRCRQCSDELSVEEKRCGNNRSHCVELHHARRNDFGQRCEVQRCRK